LATRAKTLKVGVLQEVMKTAICAGVLVLAFAGSGVSSPPYDADWPAGTMVFCSRSNAVHMLALRVVGASGDQTNEWHWFLRPLGETETGELIPLDSMWGLRSRAGGRLYSLDVRLTPSVVLPSTSIVLGVDYKSRQSLSGRAEELHEEIRIPLFRGTTNRAGALSIISEWSIMEQNKPVEP